MGQYDILELLKKENKWLSPKEISHLSGSSIKSVTSSLRGLKRWNFVEWRYKESMDMDTRGRGDLEYRFVSEYPEVKIL